MKIDEQEFRSFIANLDKAFLISENSIATETYQIARIKAISQILIYKKMLETPKPSKWKQTKLL